MTNMVSFFKWKVKDVIFLQLGQPILANVFLLLKCIEFNMIEEFVVTFMFNKDSLRNSLTPSAQQPHG